MKFGLVLVTLAFTSEVQENKVENAKSEETFQEENAENLLLVKIEEDDYTKETKKTSQYCGVSYNETRTRWFAQRWSKNEKKMLYNGFYIEEETAAHASDTLARKLKENGEQNHKLNFPDDKSEVFPEKTKTSKYFGIYYSKSKERWSAQRWNKSEKKPVFNGFYKNEETAAHASDTLARKLMENGEQNHKLNFPDDKSEVFPEKKTSSKYFGVSYCELHKTWNVRKWSKTEKKMVCNGVYKNEETAAHASDTLARQLMANGDQNHRLNFPDDKLEVFPEAKTPKYFGVSYDTSNQRWRAQRWSKSENKTVPNGAHKNEETAALASDTLARQLMANGEQNHKLNFPDKTEQKNKRKRSEHENVNNMENSQSKFSKSKNN